MRRGQEYYPDVESEPGFTLSAPQSPYGEPAPTIMEVLTKGLEPGSKILDVAGGDGRYAVPLARAPSAHNVHILDNDLPHLTAAQRRASEALGEQDGKIITVEGDVLDSKSMNRLQTDGLIDDNYDATLCAAFLYLFPPDIAKEIFTRTSGRLLRLGGLAVVQFSTNIIRLGEDGRRIVGKTEYNYSESHGRDILQDMYMGAGFENPAVTTYKIDEERMQADVLIASGIKYN